MKNQTRFILALLMSLQLISLQDKLCMSVDTTGKCSLCFQSYLDSTKGLCTVPNVLVSNARSYNSDSTVKQCINGYYISSSIVCSQINSTQYPNCAQLNTSGNACAKCMSNYSLVSTTPTSGSPTITCDATAAANCAVSNCVSCNLVKGCTQC